MLGEWGQQWPLEFYGAYLVNHAAERMTTTNNKKANRAWYLGANLGDLRKVGDMTFGARWEDVAAQAVGDFDMKGFGTGNIVNKMAGTNFYDATSNARGMANYRGYGLGMSTLMMPNLVMGC